MIKLLAESENAVTVGANIGKFISISYSDLASHTTRLVTLLASFYSLEECISKLKAWKIGVESKGLRVNMKMKFLFSGPGVDVLKGSGKHPCAVCLSGVGANSIQCSHF